MNAIENDTDPPPPPALRYIAVPSQQGDEWLCFRAVHAVSGLPISCRTWAKLLSQYSTLGSEFTSFLRDLHLDGMLWECRGTSNKNASTTPFEFAIVAAPALEHVAEADPEPFSKHLFGSSTVPGEVSGSDQDSVEVECATESEDASGDGNGDASRDGTSESSESSNDSSESNEQKVAIGCVFENFGGDATLVAPRPTSKALAKDNRFAHLANYIKLTPLEEAGNLWSLVATEYEKKMTEDADSEQPVYLSTNGLGVSFLSFRLERNPKYYNYKAFSQPELTPANTTPDSLPLQIQIASDLHTEFYGLHSTSAPLHLIVPRAPVMALLGDIGNAFTDSLRAYLHIQAGIFEKVLFIVGNHEFYNNGRTGTKSVTEQWAWLKRVCAERDNIYLLEKDSVDVCGIRILGTALWSDIPDDMLQDAEMAMNDYALCYNHKEGEDPRQLTSAETREWYQENVQWIRDELDKARQEGVPTVVLTHHTPHLNGTSHPRFAGDALSCCFSSDLTDLLTFPVKLWACGHTHYNFDMDFGGTRLLSNQRGYKGEANSDYRRDEVLEIHPIL